MHRFCIPTARQGSVIIKQENDLKKTEKNDLIFEFLYEINFGFLFHVTQNRIIYFQLIERFTQLSVCVALVTCIIVILGAIT